MVKTAILILWVLLHQIHKHCFLWNTYSSATSKSEHSLNLQGSVVQGESQPILHIHVHALKSAQPHNLETHKQSLS